MKERNKIKKIQYGTQSHGNDIIQYEKITKEHNETQTLQIQYIQKERK